MYLTAPECQAGKYKELKEAEREVNYESNQRKCDSDLSGWFRFTGEAGTQMPETPPKRRSCGTGAPGWLNGKHPAVAEGVVQRKVCFFSGMTDDKCKWSRVVSVRYCGQFYVYKFSGTPRCNLRYCGFKVGKFSPPLIIISQLI